MEHSLPPDHPAVLTWLEDGAGHAGHSTTVLCSADDMHIVTAITAGCVTSQGQAAHPLTEEVVMTRACEESDEREMIMPLLAVVKSELATLQHHPQHGMRHSVRLSMR
jgi:hypothetical protein